MTDDNQNLTPEQLVDKPDEGQPEEAVTKEIEDKEAPTKESDSKEDNAEESTETDVLAKLEKGEKLSKEELAKIKDWKDKGLMRADYTQKTQAIAEKEKELKELESSFKSQFNKKEENTVASEEAREELSEDLKSKFISREEVEPLIKDIQSFRFDSKIAEAQKTYGDNFPEVLKEARQIFDGDPNLLKDTSKYDLVFKAASASVLANSALKEGADAERESSQASADDKKASNRTQPGKFGGYSEAEIDSMTAEEIAKLGLV